MAATGNPVLEQSKSGGRFEVSCSFGQLSPALALALVSSVHTCRPPALSHFQVIGRVPGLLQLNGAEIRPLERRDAELRYLQVRRRAEVPQDEMIARKGYDGHSIKSLMMHHPHFMSLTPSLFLSSEYPGRCG